MHGRSVAFEIWIIKACGAEQDHCGSESSAVFPGFVPFPCSRRRLQLESFLKFAVKSFHFVILYTISIKKLYVLKSSQIEPITPLIKRISLSYFQTFVSVFTFLLYLKVLTVFLAPNLCLLCAIKVVLSVIN